MASLTGNWWPSITLKEGLAAITLYPFLAAFSAALSIYALIAANVITVGLHILDWVKELSMAKKLSARTNKGKERLDGYFQQILLSIRTMFIMLLLFSLQFTVLAIYGTLYSIYSALFKKDGSVTGRGIRLFFNGISKLLLGEALFEGPEAATDNISSSPAGVPLKGGKLDPKFGSGETRKSSVKPSKSAGHQCEVINEGSHFNRVARGCLLPPVE